MQRYVVNRWICDVKALSPAHKQQSWLPNAFFSFMLATAALHVWWQARQSVLSWLKGILREAFHGINKWSMCTVCLSCRGAPGSWGSNSSRVINYWQLHKLQHHAGRWWCSPCGDHFAAPLLWGEKCSALLWNVGESPPSVVRPRLKTSARSCRESSGGGGAGAGGSSACGW